MAGAKAERSIWETQFRLGLPFGSRNRSTKKPRPRLRTSMSISAATEEGPTARVVDKLHQSSRLICPLSSWCATTFNYEVESAKVQPRTPKNKLRTVRVVPFRSLRNGWIVLR